MLSTRRTLLTAFLALPIIEGKRLQVLAQDAPRMARTFACDDDAETTLEREAGPFFRPNSPLERDLYPAAPGGERITVAGFVFDDRCRPLPGSLVEIWHADESGRYDSSGFRLRGHQFTDGLGRWWFNTVIPALYPVERVTSISRYSDRGNGSDDTALFSTRATEQERPPVPRKAADQHGGNEGWPLWPF